MEKCVKCMRALYSVCQVHVAGVRSWAIESQYIWWSCDQACGSYNFTGRWGMLAITAGGGGGGGGVNSTWQVCVNACVCVFISTQNVISQNPGSPSGILNNPQEGDWRKWLHYQMRFLATKHNRSNEWNLIISLISHNCILSHNLNLVSTYSRVINFLQ